MVMNRKLHRVLVVEDDAALRKAVVRTFGGRADTEVLEAGSAAEARKHLGEPRPPDLMIIDVRLPDASAFEVLDVAQGLSPAPVVVAMSGKASPEEAFRLAQHGVRAYLPKPFSLEELASAVEAARSDAPNLTPMLAASVGRIPMRELQNEVRRVMVKEALARSDGSRSGAARLLQVTRQAVQQIIQSVTAAASKGSARKRPPPSKI